MDKAEVIISASIAAVVLALVIFSVEMVIVERACLKAGYPKSRVDYTLTGYCVRIVDQTEVVVPADEVGR